MSLLGYPVPRHRDAALARAGAIVDEPRFHRHLTGRQNLRLVAAAREPAARDRIGPALERAGLARRADERVSEYSMGMRQRLGAAACLLGDPGLLLMSLPDEPMNGLDPAGMAEMRDMILSMVAEGRTVVLSSHLLDEVERTCDAVAIVDRGSIIGQGPISGLLAGRRSRFRSDAPNPAGPVPCSRAPPPVPASRPCRRRWGWGSRCPRARGRGVIAEINRVLVEGGISVCRLQPVQASLESWFLQVTTRLGDPEMTTMPASGAPAPARAPRPAPAGRSRGRRGSPVPAAGMIAARVMELRRRRGLMIALIVVNIGLPAVFLLIRLLAHAFAPRTSPPAGGHEIFVVLVAGFIAAATVGCTAGSRDLTEGMFRHLVVTGRSPLALYLARIPAGSAIVVPLAAIGYTIVCAVCVFAAPATINDNGVNMPPGLSRAGFANWAGNHAKLAVCYFPCNGPVPGNVTCAGGPGGPASSATPGQARPRPPRWKLWPPRSPGTTTPATPAFSSPRRTPP